MGSLTGRPSVPAILSIDFFAALYYSKDRKRARYQQTVTPSSCHCKMTASFAGLGGHFAYVRNNPANNTTKIAMRSIFAYTAFTSFPFGMRQTSPPFPQGMEDITAYRRFRQPYGIRKHPCGVFSRKAVTDLLGQSPKSMYRYHFCNIKGTFRCLFLIFMSVGQFYSQLPPSRSPLPVWLRTGSRSFPI